MKHRTITGSIQTKKKRYYCVLNVYDKQGKRHQKWIKTDYKIPGNKKKAEQELHRILSEYNDRNHKLGFDGNIIKGESEKNNSDNITVAEYFEEWLKEIQPVIKPNTYRGYKGNMENHVIPYFKEKNIMLKDLKAYDLELYYKSKLAHNSKINGSQALSRTTIKHHHQNISKALSDALKKGIILYNPASGAKPPKTEKFRSEFYTPEQINALLKLFKGSVIELPVTLSAMYGLRRSEVCGLKWHNISFENRSITICETLQQNTGGNYTDTTKTDSSYRTLPMTDKIYELLQKKKQSQQQNAELLGDGYNNEDYVCTWDNGKVITPNYLSRTFHNTLEKSNLPVIRLHDLRHSVASNLLTNGCPVNQVSDFLGHESPNTTLKFYSHVDKTSKIAAANKMDELLSF